MKRILYLLVFSFILFTGCKKEAAPEPKGNSYIPLSEYLVKQNLDLNTVLDSWITAAPAAEDLATIIDTYDILDIRGVDDYDAGHIEGATNTTLKNILNAAQSTSKPILVACYTGQTASHAVVALRLSGYPTAKVLKWGMSGWNSSLSGPWNSSIGNTANDHAGSWAPAPGSITATGSFDVPNFTTDATDGAGILVEQVSKMLNNGFKGVSNTDVLTTPANYFINNYWTTENVTDYGNITGAYRINPLTIADNLTKGLDPSQKVVTYCWTGQTSSMITAYLNVIGYDALSLKFGANGMIYDNLHSHQFVTPTVDLPLETSTTPTNSFETLSAYLVEQDLDLPKVLDGWITARPAEADLATFLGTYDILDIRGESDFTAGHIDGAVNTTLGNILTAADNTTKPILVVCYTGQTASHAVVALRLSGHLDAKVLKWGMSGWSSSLSGPWNSNIGNAANDHSGSWIAPPGSLTATGSFDYPSYTATATDGAGILEEQVEQMLTNGFKGVSNTDVLTNPGDYFINNYWAITDVEHYGHITGAYRINPLSIVGDEISGLNPSETIVTYCWTGQTSSMVTAYLNVIGYNAVSLKFGTNGMIYDTLESHKFVTPTTDLPVVTD